MRYERDFDLALPDALIVAFVVFAACIQLLSMLLFASAGVAR